MNKIEIALITSYFTTIDDVPTTEEIFIDDDLLSDKDMKQMAVNKLLMTF